MDDFIFARDCDWVLSFELIEPTFLFKHVFDESASTISHFAQSVSKSPLHLILSSVSLLSVNCLIRHVPDIMRDKLFHSLPLALVYQVLLQALECFG